MAETRRKYDREFKLKAVELSYQTDNSRELAFDLGGRPELIYRWRSKLASLSGKSFPGNGTKNMTEEEAEVARLKKELANMTLTEFNNYLNQSKIAA